MMRHKKQLIVRQVVVSDYAAEGKSLAKVDGKVIFISGAVPGDKVDIQVTKSKKDWAEARVIHVHEFSPLRTDPFCRHFGVCGGCKWQMLPYEKQLRYKQREVEEHLRRIGKVELPPVMPILGASETRFYRNKLEYTFSSKRYYPEEEFQRLREQGIAPQPALGYHIPRYFDKVIDIEECHLQDEPSNSIRNAVREISSRLGFSFYDIRSHEGWLRNLVIRTSTTGEVMLNFCLGYHDEKNGKKLFDEVLQMFPSVTTLVYTINGKMNDSIHDLDPQVYFGPGFITEKLEDFQFRIGPKSFFQTNSRQGEKLYQVARDFAELSGKETLYDLYCGTGSIGIFMSKKAARVVGVEVIEEAVKDAEVNAAVNGLDHTRFFAGDVAEICHDGFFLENGRPDVVITDPPRAGMHGKLVGALMDIAAPIVVYVSCNPATQARDLSLLDEKYSVNRIQPVDMFPHTHHIENVVQLRLR
jgi:23S rRNA (uracil1939-C5)-methyltransferase